MDSSTQEILIGKWHELKGKARQQWGKLTDDDITQVNGNGTVVGSPQHATVRVQQAAQGQGRNQPVAGRAQPPSLKGPPGPSGSMDGRVLPDYGYEGGGRVASGT